MSCDGKYPSLQVMFTLYRINWSIFIILMNFFSQDISKKYWYVCVILLKIIFRLESLISISCLAWHTHTPNYQYWCTLWYHNGEKPWYVVELNATWRKFNHFVSPVSMTSNITGNLKRLNTWVWSNIGRLHYK